jgi:hypothetical protein
LALSDLIEIASFERRSPPARPQAAPLHEYVTPASRRSQLKFLRETTMKERTVLSNTSSLCLPIEPTTHLIAAAWTAFLIFLAHPEYLSECHIRVIRVGLTLFQSLPVYY